MNAPAGSPPRVSTVPAGGRSGILWGWVGIAFVIVALAAWGWYRWAFPEPRRRLAGAMVQYVGALESGPGTDAVTLSGRLQVEEAVGRWQPWHGSTIRFWLQPPDHLRLEWIRPGGMQVWIRRGETLEVHVPDKRVSFRAGPAPADTPSPDSPEDGPSLGPIRSPVPPGRVWMAVLTLEVDALEPRSETAPEVYGFRIRPKPRVVHAGVLPEGELRAWLRQADGLPVRVEAWSGSGRLLWKVRGEDWRVQPGGSPDLWRYASPDGLQVHEVPLRELAGYWRYWLRPLPRLGPDSGHGAAGHLRWGSRNSAAVGPRGDVDLPVIVLDGDLAERASRLGRTLAPWVAAAVRSLVHGWAVEQALQQGRWMGSTLARWAEDAEWRDVSEARFVWAALGAAARLEDREIRAAHGMAVTALAGTELIKAGADGAHGMAAEQVWRDLGGYLSAIPPVGIIHRPRVGLPWATVAPLGLWGGWMGINSKQLAVLVEPGPGLNGPAAHVPVLVGRVLEQCSDLASAAEHLRGRGRSSGMSFLLVDGRTGEALRVTDGRVAGGPDPRSLVSNVAGSHPAEPGRESGRTAERPFLKPGVPALPQALQTIAVVEQGQGQSSLAWTARYMPLTFELWIRHGHLSGTVASSHTLRLELKDWLWEPLGPQPGVTR